MEERSLDEFVEADDESGGSEDNASTDATDDATGEQQSSEPPADPSTVEAATPTSRYEPDGTPCEECDEEVRRLWVDEELSVCGSCKPW